MKRIFDAQGATLGRLCTTVAKSLLNGDEVAIINSEKALISGKKQKIKQDYKDRRELGTYRKGPFIHRSPERIVRRTVRGMIPYQTSHGRAAYKRLKCYIGVPDEFQGKEPEIVEHAKRRHVEYITVEEISRFLGANF
ncbi:MAG: 50S ribosomal protein L13 [Candidatus Thermoplasmatota archaeon]|nr:50S ribosomal protein L13 [Candidatus Thermoplasmatota archaeon]